MKVRLIFALWSEPGGLPSLNHDLFPVLLISFLGLALGIGMICFLLVCRSVRSRRSTGSSAIRTHRRRSFLPTIFDWPCRWLVIKGSNLPAAQQALGLHNPRPCSWTEGLARAQELQLFISPPVGGWMLVMGSALPEPADDVDKLFRYVVDLSRKLGTVQFFNVNRLVNHHAWVIADGGRIIRAYAWAGETLWIQGRVTAAETGLGIKCYGYGERPESGNVPAREPAATNAEKVLLLAARWSIDPTAIDEMTLSQRLGIAGELMHSRRP